MQIDNTIDETSSPNRKTSENPIEILENDIETVTNDYNDENVYEINPVITWETLQNYRETSDCEPFNVIMDKFERIQKQRFSPGFWDSKISHKLYMLILRIKLRSYTMESLYKIYSSDLKKNYGCRLYYKYNDSTYQLVKSIYPEYEWLFWKFNRAPTNSWDSRDNQLQYMTWLGEKLCYTSMEDWFQVKQDHFHINYGGGLLAGRHDDSPSQLLKSVYPNYEWYFWKFTQAPHTNAWDSRENQLQYMTWLGEHLGYTTMEDWYQVTTKIFIENYGSSLVTTYYNSSPILLLKSIYPEYEWLFWKFLSAPNNSWDSRENQLQYMTWLGEHLGYTTMEDWYQITQNDFYNNYGRGICAKYNGSPYQLVKSIYPEYEWLFWKFSRAPQNSWDSRENQLQYMTWLGEHLGYTTMEDWYQITLNDFYETYGSGILNHYNSSPYRLIIHVYPEYEWLFWRFRQAPSGLWDSRENQLQYMTWLGEHLGFTNMEDLYQIDGQHFEDNYGSSLLSRYNSSPLRLLNSLFPTENWSFWKLGRASKNSWESKENQLQYITWLGEHLGYATMNDWYKITKNDFYNNHGGCLLSKYNSSPYRLIIHMYPEYEWLFWRFGHAPSGLWDSRENQLQYMTWLGEHLGYSTMNDWYKITRNDFYNNYGSSLLSKYKTCCRIMFSLYPNFEWDRTKFIRQYSEQQIEWLNFLQKYYGISVQHACNDGEYRIPETRYYADGFCRDTNTIYEYHGDYWHGNPRIFSSDDFNKSTKCTYGELYDNTYKRESEIRGLGYNLVVMWESDWIRINNAIRKLQKKYSLRKNN